MTRITTPRRVDATLPKEPIMATSPHAPGHPYQHASKPSRSDWIEDVAVALAVLTAIVILACILALLIIV